MNVDPMTAFDLQLVLTGCDIRGTEPWELTAHVAESPGARAIHNGCDIWDRSAAHLLAGAS